MPSRRLILAIAGLLLAVASLGAQEADPAAIVTSIYGAHDVYGAAVSLQVASGDRRALSAALAALWTKADAATPDGDEAPPGFDIASNSQGMEVQSAAVSVERRDAARATVVARLTPGAPWMRHSPEENVVRYDFVRQNGAWKIDDVRGTIGDKQWSIRALLTRPSKP